jgi:hypothetical protein
MASTQEKFVFEGKNDKTVYNAALEAVPLAGLKVWKTRELARLVLAQGMVDGAEVRCNIAVSMVDGSTTITAESDHLPEETLTATIHRIKASLDQVLE